MYKDLIQKLANIQDFFAKAAMLTLEHRIITSLIFSIVATYLYSIKVIQNIRDILPQIISFASIMLAVLSLVFSIIISVKDGKMYQRIKDVLNNAIDELHKILKESIIFSVLVVLYSLALMVFKINYYPLKCALGSIGSFLFGMMTCLCISVFLISLTLLKNSDKD